jgi:tRNA pseudouridine55 synthase
LTATPPRTAARPKWQDVHGIFLLDKASGITSNTALQQARRVFQARKAGHSGSLDPLATGMLPICFGEATKFAGQLLGADKTYEVTLLFGVQTDTADADGQPIAESPLKDIPRDVLESALASFRGPIRQVPPMYSALKYQGQRLYELARAGKEVERAPRDVVIRHLEVLAWSPMCPVLRVECSKGTYIRSLVEDIAVAAGSLAHVKALRRVLVEPFAGCPMVTQEVLERIAGIGTESPEGLLLPVDAALKGLPAVDLDDEASRQIRQGKLVDAMAGLATGPARLFGPNREFLGLGTVEEGGRVRARRLMSSSLSPH